MSSARTITKNISTIYTARIIGYILSFLFYMHAARYLGAVGFGILSFAVAFTGMLGIFTDLGLNKFLTREIAKDRARTVEYLSNSYLIKLMLSATVAVLIFTIINRMKYPDSTKTIVYILAASTICNTFIQLCYSVFQAHENIRYEAAGRILTNVLLLTGALVLIHQRQPLLSFAALYLGVNMLILAYISLVTTFIYRPSLSAIDRDFCKYALLTALPFGLLGIFEVIYHWIDTVMLSFMKGDIVVGWYNAAYRILVVILFIPSAINIVIFPVMSRYSKSSENALRSLYWKYFKYMSLTGIFLGVNVMLLADKIIMFIFGAEFRPAVPTLKILIWSPVLIFINSASVRLLESVNKQVTVTRIAALAAVLNVILNLIFITTYSYAGAAIATVLSELFIAAGLLYAMSKTVYKINSYRISILLTKTLIAGLFTGAAIIHFDRPIYWAASGIVALAVYLTVLYILKVFDSDDYELLSRLLYEDHHH